jgi:hypothetical protein
VPQARRRSARRLDGGSAERFEHFAETGGAAHEKIAKNSRNALKIGGCPDFIEYECRSGAESQAQTQKREGKPKRECLGRTLKGAPARRGPAAIGRSARLKGRNRTRPQFLRQSRGRRATSSPQSPAGAAARQVAGGFGEAAGDAFTSAASESGREFAGPGGAVYCHPCSSFDKGAGKRRSGLAHRFAEKERDAGGMPTALYAKAADWGGNLSRKIMGFRTPAEMFERNPQNSARGGTAAWDLAAPAPASPEKNTLWNLLHLMLQFIQKSCFCLIYPDTFAFDAKNHSQADMQALLNLLQSMNEAVHDDKASNIDKIHFITINGLSQAHAGKE